MIAEIGLVALILAAIFSVIIGVLPFFGLYTKNHRWALAATKLTYGQLFFVAFAVACLLAVFCLDDFSVKYVTEHSSKQLPIYYKISALWGGHEGSLLLWIFILSCWCATAAYKSKKLSINISSVMLAILGCISAGFLAIILFTSNPFIRNLPFIPKTGNDLNPLLQDVAMIIHPPILYMGYVGFAVPFAFMLSCLIANELTSNLVKWIRNWAILAWVFLTCGITLGSWWAYYELGWGGWWFWDPVENASLIPWLIGTALIHSLAITEKRGIFKNWTILLAILAFILTVLGTFLVRSGVISSVHSFTSDPQRGIFILVFLALLSICSFLLFITKPISDQDATNINFNACSRESMLLANNWLLVVSALVILFGTLFPVLVEALNLGIISVGAPYFNAVFIPIMLLTAFFLGLAMVLSWQGQKFSSLFNKIKYLLLISIAVSIALVWYIHKYEIIYQGLATASIIWLVGCCLLDIKHKIKHNKGLMGIKTAYWGMQSAHLGFAIVMLGILISCTFSSHKNIVLTKGESATLGDYKFEFSNIQQKTGANYLSNYATINVYKNNKHISYLHPEKRIFQNNIPMTEVALDAGLWRDLYIALAEPIDTELNTWSFRIQIKAMVRWIWLGAILMALGGILAIIDRRYIAKKYSVYSATKLINT